MDIIHTLILAFIQGVTEFLPISSSAHLILPSLLLGWEDQGLAFDVAVHVGTLAAVVIYFRKDLIELTCGWFGQFSSRSQSPESRLGWSLIIATVPAGLAGLIFHDLIATHLRSIWVLATTTLVFGLLLGLADRRTSSSRSMSDMTWRVALIVGAAQALALIPGTSRSGITMTAALFLGFSRMDAARFSFLLSIPIIALSGGFQALEVGAQANTDWMRLLLGAAVSFISAYACIHLFLGIINRLSLMPFVIYRLLLGVILVVVAI